jgi:hypothetical protein
METMMATSTAVFQLPVARERMAATGTAPLFYARVTCAVDLWCLKGRHPPTCLLRRPRIKPNEATAKATYWKTAATKRNITATAASQQDTSATSSSFTPSRRSGRSE